MRIKVAVLFFLSGILLRGSPLVVFNNTPVTLAPTETSLEFGPNSVSAFGDQLLMACAPLCALQTVTVVAVSQALQADFPDVGTDAGFNVPITLNVYDDGSGNVEGALQATFTEIVSIGWDMPPSPGCASGGWQVAPNTTCYNGVAQLVQFTNLGVTVAPNSIVEIAWGATGPAADLGLGVTNLTPSVGSYPNPGITYVNNAQTNALGGYGVMADISGVSAVPEPGSIFLFLSGLSALMFYKRRGRR